MPVNLKISQCKLCNLKKKKKEKEMGYEDLWNNFKKAYIWVIGVPGKQTLEEKENIRRNNFPNLIKDKRIDLRSSRIPKKEKSKKRKT